MLDVEGGNADTEVGRARRQGNELEGQILALV